MSSVNFSVHLKPGAKKNAIVVEDENSISISVTARPVDGQANEHLIKILSKALRLRKSAIEIFKGQKSRNKAVAISDMDRVQIIEKLKSAKIK